MKRFGLIGHPVAGSFSPRLFEAAYGGRYAYDLIEGAEFGASWRRFLEGYHGINVTAPFKLDAFESVDVLTESARLCGAVNLAVKTRRRGGGMKMRETNLASDQFPRCSLQPRTPKEIHRVK